MLWSFRLALGPIGFAVTGLALLALNPRAESARDRAGEGYIFAISSGPGLKLANEDNAIKRGNVPAYAMAARSLSCAVVMTIGSIEFGTRCAFEPDEDPDKASAASGSRIETGSLPAVE